MNYNTRSVLVPINVAGKSALSLLSHVSHNIPAHMDGLLAHLPSYILITLPTAATLLISPAKMTPAVST